jgi:hypothetical protein
MMGWEDGYKVRTFIREAKDKVRMDCRTKEALRNDQ